MASNVPVPTAMPSIISVSDSDLHEQSVPGTVLHPAPTGHRSRTRPVALRLNSTTTVAESDDLTDEFIADTNLSPGFTPTLSPGLSPLHAMPKRSAMRTASVSAETESPSPLPVSKSVAWGSDVEQQPETPKPRISRRNSVRDSFSRFARRLTYDFQSNLQLFNTLPPTTRNRYTVLLFFVIGCVLLTVALGAGLPMLGRVYNYNIPVAVPQNGMLEGPTQFFGIILLLFFGTGGIMLLANLVPSLVILNFSFNAVRVMLAAIVAVSLMAIALTIYYLIEPQKTFTDTVVIGSNDPILSTVGAFYLFAFAFLFFLSGGILVHMLPQLSRLRKSLHAAAIRINHRVVAIVILNLFLGFTVSNFVCSPIGAGETWAGRYFRATSPYSLVNWVWSRDFVYKLFPDVMGYYLFVAVVIVTTVLAHRRPSLAKWLHRRCYAPTTTNSRLLDWHPFQYGISNGEVLLMVAFFMFGVFWVCYWRIIFDYTEKKVERVTKINTSEELAARTMGSVATLFCAVALLPASRTGVWVDVFGVPYDRCIKYHRVLGTLATLLVTLHAWIWWNKAAKEGSLGNKIISINSQSVSSEHTNFQDFSIPLIEAAWFLLVLSLLSAVLLRRKLYHIFQYSHKYIGVLFYIAAIIHAWNFWYITAGSLLLWYVDKLSRGIRAAYLCAPSELEWHPRNNVVKLKLGKEAYKSYQPGQYFFINIPQISMNEWHPFTASAVLDDGILFYIKSMPRQPGIKRVPWTLRLAELVQTSTQLPVVRLSGPFGHAHFSSYRSLVLFAGGIGITPMIAIFTSLLQRAKASEDIGDLQSVALIWMSRSVVEFRLFEEIFKLVHGSTDFLASKDAQLTTSTCKFDIRLHCTRRDSYVSLVSPDSVDYIRMHVAQGRCDIAASLASFNLGGTDTLAAVCGPQALTMAVSRAAWALGTDYHAEQFAF